MKINVNKISLLIKNYPVLSVLISLNMIGIIIVLFHFYSIKMQKKNAEKTMWNKVLSQILPTYYPREFENKKDAMKIISYSNPFYNHRNINLEQISWLMSKFNAPPNIKGQSLLDRYTSIIMSLLYTSPYMTKSEKKLVEPEILNIFAILPKGSNHILALDCADLIANLGNKSAIPALRSSINLYPDKHDKARLENDIDCLATGKLVS